MIPQDYISKASKRRGMKIGIWITILGVLALVAGGGMYAADYHRTIGSAGAILGLVLIIVGVAWWTMKDRSAKSAAPMPAQPPQPAKTP